MVSLWFVSHFVSHHNSSRARGVFNFADWQSGVARRGLDVDGIVLVVEEAQADMAGLCVLSDVACFEESPEMQAEAADGAHRMIGRFCPVKDQVKRVHSSGDSAVVVPLAVVISIPVPWSGEVFL